MIRDLLMRMAHGVEVHELRQTVRELARQIRTLTEQRDKARADVWQPERSTTGGGHPEHRGVPEPASGPLTPSGVSGTNRAAETLSERRRSQPVHPGVTDMTSHDQIIANREYVHEVRSALGLDADTAARVADFVLAEYERMGSEGAEAVFNLKGQGPVCSFCGTIAGLCKHLGRAT